MKKKLFIFSIVSCLVLSGCMIRNQSESESGNEPKEKTASLDKEEQKQMYYVDNKEVLATNLNAPWSISNYEDTFYITERSGHIVKVDEEEVVREEIILNEPLLVYGEGGLLGMALHPDFEKNQLAFIYHTYGTEQEVKNRIVLIKHEQGKWSEQKVIVESMEGAIFHNGGRLKIGPDNKLYATVGDANKPELAQDMETLPGSILRINLDGSVPEDNPFQDSYVYSFGHRNPQGLIWNMETGEMYASEHGPSAYDEINIIEKGKNYGWPVATGDQTPEGMEPPLFHSGNETWAPSGIDLEDGVLFVANLRGEMISVFELSSGNQTTLWNENGRIRDVLKVENYLYVVSNNTDGRGNPGQEDDLFLRLEVSSE